jgi:hypothetical protein
VEEHGSKTMLFGHLVYLASRSYRAFHHIFTMSISGVGQIRRRTMIFLIPLHAPFVLRILTAQILHFILVRVDSGFAFSAITRLHQTMGDAQVVDRHIIGS